MRGVGLWCPLVLAGIGGVLFALHRPEASLLALPGPIELPERLPYGMDPHVAAASLAPTGVLLLAAAALLVFLWRRGAGATPFAAFVPGALMLLHSGMLAAVTSGAGVADLAGLCLLAAGAACAARLAQPRRGAWLVLATAAPIVLCAPSGAAIALLGSFALLERRARIAAALLLLLGVARACGLPSPFEALDGAATLGIPAPRGDGMGFFAAFSGSAAACAPWSFAPLVPPPAAAWWDGAAVLAVLVLLALASPLRVAPLGALAALLLLALAGASGETFPATALLPALVLAGLSLAACAGAPTRSSRVRLAAGAACVALLGTAGVATARSLERFDTAAHWFAASAHDRRLPADAHPLTIAAWRSALAPLAPLALRARVDAALSDPDALPLAYRRDLAFAASLAGLHDQAMALLAADAAALLDVLDVALRAGQADRVLDAVERRLAGDASDISPRERAGLLCRQGSAHVLRAFDAAATAPLASPASDAFARADASFTAAIAADPGDAEALLMRGRLRMAENDAVGAVRDLEAAAGLRPDCAAPRLELAKLYFSRSQDEAGERELLLAQRISGRDTPEVSLATAQLLLARGDVAGAAARGLALVSLVHRLRGGERELAALLRLVARSAEDRGLVAQALECAQSAERLATDASGDTAVVCARLLRQQRDFDGELAVLEDAERRGLPIAGLQDLLTAALKNAGYARFLAGDGNGARDRFVALFERAEELDELAAVAEILRNLDEKNAGAERERLVGFARRAFEDGTRELLASRPARAEKLLRTSIALLPENAYAHYHLGLALERLDRADEARAEFEAAVRCAEEMQLEDVAAQARRRL